MLLNFRSSLFRRVSILSFCGKIDFACYRNMGRAGRLFRPEGMPVSASRHLFVHHPNAKAFRPQCLRLEGCAGMAQIHRDFFIDEGFEAFYKLSPVSFDGRFVVKDFQHCPFSIDRDSAKFLIDELFRTFTGNTPLNQAVF